MWQLTVPRYHFLIEMHNELFPLGAWLHRELATRWGIWTLLSDPRSSGRSALTTIQRQGFNYTLKPSECSNTMLSQQKDLYKMFYYVSISLCLCLCLCLSIHSSKFNSKLNAFSLMPLFNGLSYSLFDYLSLTLSLSLKPIYLPVIAISFPWHV